MQDGIGAALTIDADIMTGLEKAQEHLDALSKAADAVASSFSKAKADAVSLASAINGMKMPAIKIDFKDSEILGKIKAVADAAAKLNSTGAGSSASRNAVSLAEMEAKANETIEKALAKKANTYESITQRIREYEKALDQLQNVSRLNATATMKVDQDRLNESITRTQTLIDGMRQRIATLGVGFNAGISQSAITDALGLDEGSYNEAMSKLRALQEARKEVLKPGISSGSDMQTQNEWAARLGEEIDRLNGKMPQLREEMERAKLAARDSGGKSRLDEALGLDEASVDEMKSKIKQIEDAMRSLRGMKGGDVLSRGAWLSSAGKEVDRLRSKMDLLNKAIGRTSEAASYMQNMITDAFSVYAIGRFLQEMVQIRAQFQMTEKSLAVIIDDANLAREMFGQIQEMAVQSPFQVSELASYTKQLAAYRIETDKLLPSMRMLSDISAGVGVDMNRLILAFGQVRAAQFLRLTEVRQFTEAGVDVLGGLADRFTELYQRSVSVGEVMDMITRKMVTFSDLEAVLQSMTGAGGMFYKMQEQQASTLQGAISNLRDRFEIALNNMGSNYDGFIQGLINGIGSILQNYQMLEVAIAGGLVFKTLSGGLALVAKGLVSVTNNTKILATAWSVLRSGGATFKTIGMAVSALGPYLAAAAAAITAIVVAIRSATKETRELKKIQKEGVAEMNELVLNYRRLAAEVVNAANGTQAQKRALEQLQQAFSNILPAQDMQIENISRLNQSYDEHIRMIRRYVDEKTREKQILEILENLNSSQSENYGYSYEDTIASMNKELARAGVAEEARITEDVWKSAITKASEGIIDGVYETTEEAFNAIGSEIDRFLVAGGKMEEIWNDWGAKKYVVTLNDIRYRLEETYDVSQKIRKINEGGLINFEENIQIRPFMEELRNLQETYNKTREQLLDNDKSGRYTNNNAALVEDMDIVMENLREEFLARTSGMGLADEWVTYLQEQINKAFRDIDLYGVDEALNRAISRINENFNLSDRLQIGTGTTTKSENESLTVYANKIASLVKERQKLLDTFKENPTEVISEDFHQVYKSADEAENHIAALNALLAELPYSAKEGTSGLKKLESALKALADAVVDYSERMDNLDSEGTDLYMAKLQELARLAQTDLPKAFDQASVSDWLDSIESKLGKEAVLDFKIRFNATNTERAIQEVAEQVNAAMEKYQSAKTFEGMGFAIAGFSTSEQIEELRRLEDEYRNIGTKDALDAAEELKRQRIDIFRSEQDEALKIMSESQKKQSSETIRIIQETAAKVKSIGNVNANSGETGVEVDPFRIDTAKGAAVNDMLQQIAKSQWDAFKNTQMYISAFGDLEGLSLNVLQKLKSELEGFAASAQNLEPSEAKTLAETLDKINLKIKQGSGEYTGFLNLVINGLSDVRKAYQAIPEAEAAVNAAFQALAEQTDSVTASKMMSLMNNGAGLDKLAAEYGVQESMLAALNTAMQDYINKVNNAKNTNNALTQNLKSLESAYSSIGSYMDDIIGLAEDVAGAFGMAFSDETSASIEAFQKGFGIVSTAITSVIGIVSSFQIILATTDITAKSLMSTLLPLLAVGVAIGAVMAAFTAADNKKIKEVERHQKAVEQLQKTYDDLTESMNNALTSAQMKRSFEDAEANLEQQKAELYAAIEAEQSRGNKTDEENLQAMYDQLDELEKEKQKLQEEYRDNLGLTVDNSMASDWASAWLDSFRETGSGLSALQDSFDDFMDNIIAQKLALGILGPFMKTLQNKIDEVMADNELTTDEIAELGSLKDTLPEYEEMLRQAAEAMGISMKDSIETSDLQKGIQNITETTGQALESLVNSMRYYVADSNAKMARMESVIAGTNGVQSPLLTAINNQTAVLTDIYDTLRSVVRAGHPKGGSAIKVFMD